MRRRPFIVWMCLLALLGCQMAMAARVCHSGMTAVAADASSDCHSGDADPPEGDGDPSCPTSESLPDLGKLPLIAPLPAGHDFAGLPRVLAGQASSSDRSIRPRDGPDLDALCRLLI